MGSISLDQGSRNSAAATNPGAGGQHKNNPLEPVEPIAIIGMAMRLPGRVRNSEDFWRLMVEKRSGLCDAPPNRLNIAGFHHPAGKPGTLPQSQAYYLDDVEIEEFDTSVFPIGRKELERLDPAQRQLLQVAYECMEDAGVSDWRGSNLGCYIGTNSEDWLDLNARETQQRGGYRGTGTGDFAISNRLSFEFDLHGPSMTIKTACSSSLVCLNLACEAIRGRECNGALVGGLSLMFSPATWQTLHDQGLLSPTGNCRTFDAAGDGYARGEAVNMIYIKRLSDAIRDGDNIRGVIRSTAANSNGRGRGAMAVPSTIAQEALIRQTYELAGISDLSETAMVECHGTGTPVGDPIETQAVANCFGDKGVIITGVKPNVGHGEGASGITSVIKSILALEHRKIPPNINFDTPNPKIPFDRYKLHVPVEVEDWPQDRAARVSVNSFGAGGANAHAILEAPSLHGIVAKDKGTNGIQFDEPKSNGTTEDLIPDSGVGELVTNGTSAPKDTADMHLLLFSAYTRGALESHFNACKASWEHQPESKVKIHDLAYTLANRREQKPYRAYAVTNKASDMEMVTPQLAAEAAPRVIWVFTGQGAQWPRMGVELIDTNETFRTTIRKLDAFLLSLPDSPSWTIEGELRKTQEENRVHGAEFGHPLTVAIQVALVDVLHSWGLKPHAVLGHSSGEMAAAYACGAISGEGAMAAAVFRGISNVRLSKKGSMAAVGLGTKEITPFLKPGVVVACENSHINVTLSGDSEALQQVIQTLKTDKPDVLVRSLRVEKAYHSFHMLDCGPGYEAQLEPFISSVEPQVDFYSTVTGKLLSGHKNLEAAYWRQNMESPVLFNSALRGALLDGTGNTVLIEIGPHPALGGPIRQILQDVGRSETVHHVGTLERNKGCHGSLLSLAGRLFQQGVSLDYSVTCPPGKFIRDIPRYQWEQETCHWLEPRLSRDWRFREHAPHELLGARVVEDSPTEPCWRNMVHLNDLPWLVGHEVDGHVIIPATGFISMIGEALRQLEGEAAYSLRNVHILAARVLEFDRPVELITSFKPIMIDPHERSPWYSFSINSFDGTKWSHNVTGEARASMDESSAPAVAVGEKRGPCFPRKVDAESWYHAMSERGINHTGIFRGMQSISAATTTQEAMATVSTSTLDTEQSGEYSFHPAILDQCIQVFAVAGARGLARALTGSRVPTFIGEMVVSPGSSKDIHVEAKLDENSTGSLVARDAGHESPVLVIKDLRTSDLGRNDETDGADLPLISQLQWMPHSDLVDLSTYITTGNEQLREMHSMQELSILCIMDHLGQLSPTEETPPHLHKHFDWMRAFIQDYHSGQDELITQSINLENLTSDERLARIEEIVKELSHTPFAAASEAVHRLFLTAESIFTGATHPLEVLRKDDLLTKIYNHDMKVDYAPVIKLIGNTTPRLRILEIGAGTGGTTAIVLQALQTTGGERLYDSYKFTDISSGFMPAAQKRFAQYEGIEYGVLDISKDPLDQGFEPHSFDLIVASNVLHATPSLSVTLGHLHSLLSTGGRVLLEEVCPKVKFMNYVMGYLSGWWLGAEDGRPTEPYVSPERWAKELVAAGFQEPEISMLDNMPPYNIEAVILASRESRVTRPSRVTLLCYDSESPYVSEVRSAIERVDIGVEVARFGDPLPTSQDVISLLDLEEPVLHGMDENTFRTMVTYLQKRAGKLIWLTQSSQVNCEDPRAAMMLGLARTARHETGVSLFTIEIDKATPMEAATEAVAKVLLRINTRHADLDYMDPDYEFAISAGRILIPRLHWQTIPEALKLRQKEKTVLSQKTLHVQSPGRLQSMHWVQGEARRPAEGEVLVQAKAAGLNFRDLMVSLGVLQNATDMGLEGSGVIQELGPGVKDFAVGDRVVYMSSGCFSTYMCVPATSCIKLDDSMSFEQAAAMPGVYTTAHMALVEKGNLRQGQSILIHSACGGVGLAAIQIAQMIGAEIYCTVSNETKVQYLMEHYGIDRSRILHSRDSSFLPHIMRMTDNRGVDLVLNSLSGDLLRASWMAVAEFGNMVEIGKRDFQRRAKLTMEPFEQNRSFIGFDLARIYQLQPKRATDVLRQCLDLVTSGKLPGPPIDSIHPAANIRDAFRTMQAAQHIGKIVVSMPNNPSELESVESRPVPDFRSDRSYLLAGGLGGLGQAVAAWMVENGARNLIFLSRSARNGPETQDFLEELRSQDCQVQLVAGSVTKFDDVQRAINVAAKPVAGIIQMSMALKDIGLNKMSFTDWTTAVEPKVQGTWNLHKASLSLNLDFFIMTSSFCGLFGNTHQANYAAANTFLGAFVQYRQRQGLAASVIDVGVMADVGYVVRNAESMKYLEKTGPRATRLGEFLDAVVVAKQRSFCEPQRVSLQPLENDNKDVWENPRHVAQGVITKTPIGSADSRFLWRRDARLGIYYNLDGSRQASANGGTSAKLSLKALLAGGEDSDKEISAKIAKAVAEYIAQLMIKEVSDVPLDRPLEDIGMDSLVAIELKGWICHEAGIEISVISIVQCPSLLHMGEEIRLAMTGKAA